MKLIGAHVSTAGGVQNAPLYANAIGANTFALFVKPPKRWELSHITDEQIEEFKENCDIYNFDKSKILAHASYMINLGNLNPEKCERSYKSLLGEARRCEQLGIGMINFHPGAHLKEHSEEACLKQIAREINRLIKNTDNIKFVIENTAGQGTNVGYDLLQIRDIINEVNNKDRVGVCIDTCHAFAAGYDLSSEYNEFWELFDNIIGKKYLSGMHLNDSKKDCGTKADRHEAIGKGCIGDEYFEKLIKDPITDNIPLILETPYPELWSEEIMKLRSYF